MRTILKLKSDGAQALLGVTLALGCALNVMLVLAFAGRAEDEVVAGVRRTAGPAVVVSPSAAGPATRAAPGIQPHGREIAIGGRTALTRGRRTS